MADWYYERDGVTYGPIAKGDLQSLLNTSRLDAETRVWTAAFGRDWRKASDEGLDLSGPAQPTLRGRGLVPPANILSVKPADALVVQERRALRRGTIADYDATDEYKPKWQWLIALSPLILFSAEYAVKFAYAGKAPEFVENLLRYSPIGLLASFAFRDAAAATNAGLNPKRRWFWIYIWLTPIGYFISRKIITRLPLTPMWVWLVCLAACVGADLQWGDAVSDAARSRNAASRPAAEVTDQASIPASDESNDDDSPLECDFNGSLVSCNIVSDQVEITDVSLNRGRCPSPIPSTEDRSKVDEFLRDSDKKDKDLMPFIMPRIAVLAAVTGCPPNSPDLSQRTCQAAPAYLRMMNDPTGRHRFGDKVSFWIGECSNLLEFSITANGNDWTWTMEDQ